MFNNAQWQELLWKFSWKEKPVADGLLELFFSIVFVCFMLEASEI